jgi:putative tryptophan/tyrosine transport system substrate-binding protein
MSYGPNFPDLFRHTVNYVDKILRGAKPADIPVGSRPNSILPSTSPPPRRSALRFPPTLLARADEVIE